MAASYMRPDPTSPTSIADAGFSTQRKGFNTDEVRAFLTSVAAELSRQQERAKQLQAELATVEADSKQAPEITDDIVTKYVGEETTRVLQAARESASTIKTRAEEKASSLLEDANDEAKKLRQDVDVEAARRRKEATEEADLIVARAKEEGREMVNEARAYRERVLADLEQRTNLARQQIDDLAAARKRLLQVFERARLVAIDVASELQSLEGPEELVNLAPTTGPVPVMVPATERPLPDRDQSDSGIGRLATGDEPADEVAESVADDDAAGAEVAESVADDDATVEETDSDAADPDPSDDTAADQDEVDDTAPADTAADDTAADEDEANVVDLFPGSAAAAADGEPADDGADAGATADDAAADPADADGLFARIRRGVAESAPAETVDDAATADRGDETEDDEAEDDAVPDTAFGRRDAALAPLLTIASRNLKRHLADEQNGVLSRLSSDTPVREVDELVATREVQEQAYVAAVHDELVAAAVAGAAEFGADDTATMRKSLEGAGALRNAIEHLEANLVDALRDRIERVVVDSDGDNDAITQRSRAIYREVKTQHIDEELEDVLRHAFGNGLLLSAEPGTPMVWTPDPGHQACPDCEDNSLAGEVPAGDAYPTGHITAPLHPGCRCLTLPAQR